jgi:malate-CoA ligase subunit beta
MDIHEYQAKEILTRYGVPVPRGALAYSPEQASYRTREIGGIAWMVKAQVHAGGRGKAGGVRLCRSDREVHDYAAALFGHKLVTGQSGAAGKLVGRLYIEEATDVARELYFGVVLDRAAERFRVIASSEGGVEIEELAAQRPEAIKQVRIEPAVGFLDFQARGLAFAIGIPASLVAQASQLFLAAYRVACDLDASMLEINPLAITSDGDLVALDAKASFDVNALYRHRELAELRDRSQEDPRESRAADFGLAYVGLDGTIGCIINGAGLAMATLDMIQLVGGRPANFLDIGGGASPERVLTAFRTVLQDANVSTVLINIFAGINRCDWVARGVVDAFRELDVRAPVVVRLAGTNLEEGLEILRESGLPMITAGSLADAARKAVAAGRPAAATA